MPENTRQPYACRRVPARRSASSPFGFDFGGLVTIELSRSVGSNDRGSDAAPLSIKQDSLLDEQKRFPQKAGREIVAFDLSQQRADAGETVGCNEPLRSYEQTKGQRRMPLVFGAGGTEKIPYNSKVHLA